MTMKHDIALMIEGREYPVLEGAGGVDLESPQVHAVMLGWDAPTLSPERQVALRAGDAVRPIRVLSAQFRDGAQRLAFLFD
jgi:hypothetical protein